jgi:hypothetical protein
LKRLTLGFGLFRSFRVVTYHCNRAHALQPIPLDTKEMRQFHNNVARCTPNTPPHPCDDHGRKEETVVGISRLVDISRYNYVECNSLCGGVWRAYRLCTGQLLCTGTDRVADRVADLVADRIAGRVVEMGASSAGVDSAGASSARVDSADADSAHAACVVGAGVHAGGAASDTDPLRHRAHDSDADTLAGADTDNQEVYAVGEAGGHLASDFCDPFYDLTCPHLRV